jgi:hypothetical protein
LPDGIFSNQKSQFGQILECLAIKDVGKIYGHLVYFTDISYIFGPFGTKCGHFGIFFTFWYVVPRKIWQLCRQLHVANYLFINVDGGCIAVRQIANRVARFFLQQLTKTGKNIPNNEQIYQMAAKFTELP